MNQGTVLANMKLKAMTHFHEKAVPTFVGPTHCSSRFAKNFTQGTNPKIFNHTAVTRGDEYLLCEKFLPEIRITLAVTSSMHEKGGVSKVQMAHNALNGRLLWPTVGGWDEGALNSLSPK